ncbi:MAG: hypothetical protein MK200_06555 [Nitrosopumilus sp.]|nr:hypothetical protein [Nitrosopumilus sp.]
MKRNKKQGETSKSDMDWMYKNINPYYNKIRNEEVEEARSKEDELELAKAMAAFKKKGGKIKKISPDKAFKSYFSKGYKPKKLPRTEETEEEASTYRDRAKDDEQKKKKHFVFGGKKKSRHGESGYGKGEEVEVDEEIFYWYIIKGDLANGKIVYAGNEKQVKLKRHDSRFGDGHVMTKSRKMKKVGDKWKKSEGVSEEIEIDEKKSSTGYELYHKTFSDAMQHAYAFAKSKGHIVDPKEIDDKVATGPKKPSSGKTNRYSLKAGRKTVEIQVANLDNKRYELNMYIEEVEIGEGSSDTADMYKLMTKGLKMMAGSPKQKEIIKQINVIRKRMGMPLMREDRDYKDEYKKFQSSEKMRKYRSELNRYNREKGTYGNRDGKDASHKDGKIVGMEDQSTNRGRAEKSRLVGSKRK